MIEFFCEKNFVIAVITTMHAAAPVRTILNIIAPPTIAHGLVLLIIRERI